MDSGFALWLKRCGLGQHVATFAEAGYYHADDIKGLR